MSDGAVCISYGWEEVVGLEGYERLALVPHASVDNIVILNKLVLKNL